MQISVEEPAHAETTEMQIKNEQQEVVGWLAWRGKSFCVRQVKLISTSSRNWYAKINKQLLLNENFAQLLLLSIRELNLYDTVHIAIHKSFQFVFSHKLHTVLYDLSPLFYFLKTLPLFVLLAVKNSGSLLIWQFFQLLTYIDHSSISI